MASGHWENDRQRRSRLIAKIGLGEVIKTATVDRGHKNGPETHMITSTGLIIICNKKTGIVVTVLIARAGQIKRYFPEGQTPKELIKIATEHTQMGYNNF